MNKISIAILFIFCSYTVPAQVKNELFVNLGGGIATHQNQTFSQSSLSGTGAALAIGYNRQKINIFRAVVSLPIQTVDINGIAATTTDIIEPTINVSWLKQISSTDRQAFYLGADLEASGLTRTSENLGNNGASFLYSNTLSVVAKLIKPLGSNNWKISGEINLGLLSWVKASDGFAFSVPQGFQTSGEFDNEDVNVIDAPYRFGNIEPIGSFNRFKTNLSIIKETKRFNYGLTYQWSMKAYRPFENGQMVQAFHSLNLHLGLNIGKK